MSKEGAVKTINEVNAELAKKARQERLQKELEAEASNDKFLRTIESNNVDLGLGETITEEQLLDQMTGNFETEATPEDIAPTRDKEVSVVQEKPIITGEDINKTGTKSLAELQSKKTVDSALSIIKSNEFGKRARTLLKTKFPDMPSKVAELERFLQSKGIATTGITDVEQWLKMIEECK